MLILCAQFFVLFYITSWDAYVYSLPIAVFPHHTQFPLNSDTNDQQFNGQKEFHWNVYGYNNNRNFHAHFRWNPPINANQQSLQGQSNQQNQHWNNNARFPHGNNVNNYQGAASEQSAFNLNNNVNAPNYNFPKQQQQQYNGNNWQHNPQNWNSQVGQQNTRHQSAFGQQQQPVSWNGHGNFNVNFDRTFGQSGKFQASAHVNLNAPNFGGQQRPLNGLFNQCGNNCFRNQFTNICQCPTIK